MSGHVAQLTVPEPTGVGGWIVVKPEGEIDIATAHRLDAVLSDVVSRDPGRLFVDLSGVVFMDSTGLRSLIRTRKQLDRTNAEMAVMPGSDLIRRLIEVAGLAELLSMTDSLPEASG